MPATTREIHIHAKNGDLKAIKEYFNLWLYTFYSLLYPTLYPTDINEPDEFEQTPLYLAAENGHTEVAQYLVEVRAASMNVQCGENKLTPLHVAVLKGHEAVVKLLLKFGADFNIQSRFGDTPLHTALYENRLNSGTRKNIIKDLIDKGADVSKTGRVHRLPLHIAMIKGWNEFITDLKAGVSIDQIDADGNTALHLAAQYGNSTAAKALIEAGAKIDLRNNSQQTPLHLAAASLSLPIVNDLITAGSGVNKEDKDYQTPLFIALANWDGRTMDCARISDALIEAGADVTVTSKSQTVLHLIARTKLLNDSIKPDVQNWIKTLIDSAKSRFNKEKDKYALFDHVSTLYDLAVSKNNNLETPFFVAVANNNDVAVAELIKDSRVIDMANRRGETPLTIAIEKGTPGMVRTLIAAGADITLQGHNNCLHLAYDSQYSSGPREIEIISDLLAAKADVNQVDSEGRTLLLRECAHSEPRIALIKILIASKADVNRTNSKNETPLMLVAHRSKELVELILNSGANLLMKNNAKETVLDIALTTCSDKTTVSLLQLHTTLAMMSAQYSLADESTWKEAVTFINQKVSLSTDIQFNVSQSEKIVTVTRANNDVSALEKFADAIKTSFGIQIVDWKINQTKQLVFNVNATGLAEKLTHFITRLGITTISLYSQNRTYTPGTFQTASSSSSASTILATPNLTQRKAFEAQGQLGNCRFTIIRNP